eukprot:gene15514-17096_t
MSPTSHAVVAETLKRFMQIATECGKQGIVVTYDLAIAKIAMQIQDEEMPLYDKVFIALGPFHIEMALFNAFGKYISESGGPHLLNECLVLAKGSTKSFQTGKNYKRFRRMHELLSLAMERLHFQAFVDNEENREEILSIIEREIQEIKTNGDIRIHSFSQEIEDIFQNYLQFTTNTSNGQLGKTAQYWMQYIRMIHDYHTFSGKRRCDLELFIACLAKLSNYFFAFNQPNYARWTVKYHDNLLKLPESHPEVYEEFQKKWFAVKRTTKSFSRTPIDLTLEQTINADAASQRTGISALTNSISARQRWAESHFLRTTIISAVFEDLGLTKKEDVSNDLKHHNVKKSHENITLVTTAIKETMNPFNLKSNPELLFNIGTGKAASQSTSEYLSNVSAIGERERKKFINECEKDPARFENPIKRVAVSTFATEAGKQRVKGKDGKLVAACLMRDLFGSILHLSLEQNIDMAEVMKYPLTPVPLSLSNVDGTMLKTPKSKLMSQLEKRVSTSPPPKVEAYVINAAFFFHHFCNLPETFGGVAKFFLKKILECDGKLIHFVSDKWISPSIKDCERDARDTSTASYNITGPMQKRPGNWFSAMRNSTFKTSLLSFPIDAWASKENASLFKGKILFANNEDKCFKFSAVFDNVIRCEAEDLFCTHEEADSRIFFHLNSLPTPCNAVIRTSDTDCLIIGLGCRSFIQSDIKIWLEVGLQSKNSQRYINIDQIYQRLGAPVCMALPAYHAFTGCDLDGCEKDVASQIAFGSLHDAEVGDLENLFLQLDTFTCNMYGKGRLHNIDEARTDIFMERYKVKRDDDPISCVKKLDGSMLPPCSRVLWQKFLRTYYAAKQWMSSTEATPPDVQPTDFGWKLDNGCYRLVWFDGETAPRSLEIVYDKDDNLADNFHDEDVVSEDEDQIAESESTDSSDSGDESD